MNSARSLLALALAVAVIAIGGVSAHRYVTLEQELTDAALARRASLSALAATILAEKLARLIDIGVSLATRVRFQELVAAQRWAEAVQILRRVPEDFNFFDRVFVADAAGTVVGDTPELPGARGTNFSDSEWFRRLSREWKPCVSQLYRRTVAPARNVIAIAVPIHGAGSDVAGVLVLEVKIETFFEWARQIDVGPEDRVVIVDSAGRAAFDSMTPIGAMPGLPGPLSASVSRIPDAAGADIVRDAAAGEPLVRGFAPAAQGWGVVILQPARAAFATRDSLLRKQLLDESVIAVFALLAIVFGTRILTHRRREDAERAHREVLEKARDALARQAERLRIVHDIDRAIIGEAKPEAISAAVIQPLRELLEVPRAIVNLFDHAAGEVEWIAAAGRRRTHMGKGVRYPMRFMGDVEGLRRGEAQRIDVHALPPGPEVEALLASGVHFYMAVPMIAGGDLIGALSFGDEPGLFPDEKIAIAQEVATQLAIAIAQARLFERVRRHGEELETANRQLRESERRYSDLLGNVQLLSVMLDRDARISYCNEYLLRLTGWRLEEVIGRSWVELFIPPDAASMNERLAVLFADRPEGRHGDNEILTRSGERRLIRWNNSVLRSAAGDVTGLASIGEDITESRRAEREIKELNASLELRVAERTAQLEAANKELGAFSYSVSHDLRAPLRAIDGFSRIVQEDYAGSLDGEGQRLLGVIRANSQKMGQLIDDLLDYSHLGRKSLSNGEIDMKRLVDEVIGDLEASGEKLPRIVVGALPVARGDATLLKQVWVNLLANAVKFSAKSGQAVIEVSGQASGEGCTYCVKDNGAGFDMRYYDKLFGVFQRLHSEEEFTGTGVGLAIVRRVVSRHGGRVWAESKLGEGAAFFFLLPKGESCGSIRES